MNESAPERTFEFTFELSEDELSSYVWAVMRRAENLIVIAATALSFGAALLLVLYPDFGESGALKVVALTCALSGLAFLSMTPRKKSLRARFIAANAWPVRETWRFDDYGVHVMTDKTLSSYAWSYLEGWKKDNFAIILLGSGRVIGAIPHRAISLSARRPLEELLQARIGDPVRRAFVQHQNAGRA